MKLTKDESRLCVIRLIEHTIKEYRYLKRQKKLTGRQKLDLVKLDSFLFGRKSAALALELVIGEKIDKIRKAIVNNDPKKKG